MPNIGRDIIPFVVNDVAFAPSTTAGVGTQVTPDFFAPVGTLKNAVLLTQNAGVAFNLEVVIGGSYVAGDEVRLTLVSNDSTRQLWRKSYTYTVQPGDSNADIATAIADKIIADSLQSETPVNAFDGGAGTISVYGKEAIKISFTAYEYTDSAAGTITINTPSTVGPVTGVFTPEVGTPEYLDRLGVPENKVLAPLYDIVRIDYEAIVPVPFIDTKGAKEIELYVACDAVQAAALVALIPN